MTGRPLVRRALATLAVIAALVAVDLAAHRARIVVDLTAEQSLTLSDATRRVIDAVDEPIRLVAIVGRDQRRAEVSALLTRYRKEDRRITWEVLDPDADPGELRRLGLDPVVDAIAAVADGGERVETGTTATEQDITAAIARIVRDRSPVVCATAGHGEPALEDTTESGLAALDALLESNGYRVEPIDLLRSPEVPDRCEALLVAEPSVALGERASTALATWLRGGGAALVLTDPSTPASADLAALTSPYGIGIEAGAVLEGDPASRLADDAATPVVHQYRSVSPVARGLPPTLYPGAWAVTEVDPADDVPEPDVEPIARTSELSYLERTPAQASFDPVADVVGPITLVAASDSSEVVDGDVRRTRLVVTGDADLASNAFLEEGGNGTLVVRALDWLTFEQDLVAVTANLARPRPLALTSDRIAYARVLTAGIVPLLLLLAGALTWAVRRGR